MRRDQRFIYDILSYHTDRSILLYTFDNGEFMVPRSAADQLKLPAGKLSFPDTLLASGRLSPSAVEEIRTLLDRGSQGVPRGRTTFRVLLDGGISVWYEMRCTTILNTAGKADYALLSLVPLRSGQKDGTDAQTDSLTGVYDRRAFLKKFSEAGEVRENCISALVLVDIDCLQDINHFLGHRQGDSVLCHAAETLTAMLSDGELCGRLGGGEFLLFLPNIPRISILRERLRIMHVALRWKLQNGYEVFAALGAACLPRDGTDFHILCEKANAALYRAKQMQGDHVAIYSPSAQPTPPPLKGDQGTAADHIFVRTFGFFDVFVGGVPIYFRGSRSKELLAMLVDRRGGFLDAEEAISRLWENEPADRTTYARYRKVAMRLKQSLEAAGIGDIVEYRNGRRRVLPEKFSCDYYRFLERGGDQGFTGTYMSNYSWSEVTLAEIEQKHSGSSSASGSKKSEIK